MFIIERNDTDIIFEADRFEIKDDLIIFFDENNNQIAFLRKENIKSILRRSSVKNLNVDYSEIQLDQIIERDKSKK